MSATESTEPMSSEEYVRNTGALCPVCGSNDLEGGRFDANIATAWQPITCLSCRATWNDIYTLTGYGELKRP